MSFLSLYFGWLKGTAGKSWMLAEIFISSFKGLKQTIELKWFELDVFKKLVETCYLPHIKLLDYSLSPTSNELTIYSHAAIGINDLIRLGDNMNIVFTSYSRFELAKFIELINIKFQKDILSTLCLNLIEISDAKDEKTALKLLDPLFKNTIWKICWNRNYSEKSLYRPIYIHDYNVCYIHGHDHQKNYGKSKHYISLDGFLGKSSEDHQGELKELKNSDVFLSQFPQTQLQQTNYFRFFGLTNLIFHPKIKPLLPYMGLLSMYLLYKIHTKNPKALPGLFSFTLKLATSYLPFLGKLFNTELTMENHGLKM